MFHITQLIPCQCKNDLWCSYGYKQIGWPAHKPVLNWASLLNLFECISVQCVLSANPHSRTSMNAADEKGLNRFSHVLNRWRRKDERRENVFRVTSSFSWTLQSRMWLVSAKLIALKCYRFPLEKHNEIKGTCCGYNHYWFQN